MCFGDLCEALRRQGIDVTEGQLRWAIRTRKVSKPRLDGSLRFDFSENDVAELCDYFSASREDAVR